MANFYQSIFAIMWFGWAAYWWISAINTKRTVRHESFGSRISHIAPLVLAAYLLSARNVPFAVLGERMFPHSLWTVNIAVGLTAAGLLFTVWARIDLGSNWSGTVTIKQDHQLVTGGPYTFVRHPIYSGLLLAFVGSAVAIDEWRGVVAVVLAVLSLWRKLRLEERWMQEMFPEQYPAYRRRVRALIPFVV